MSLPNTFFYYKWLLQWPLMTLYGKNNPSHILNQQVLSTKAKTELDEQGNEFV